MTDVDFSAFEKKLDAAYRRFTPLAARYHHVFTRPAVTPGGMPCALFLGNHSSGKSSLVNSFLCGDPVQTTGVAPTDDGFTVVIYGETEEDVCGPAALSRLPDDFAAFSAAGSTFLQHLRVKIRNRPILKHICLVDSPGMIDAAAGTSSRTYDFCTVVRRFAEVCDLVFFLFDPEKPGTTGETVDVFSRCLEGLEFKLHVLLNKCDAFAGVSDFARAYGTLCWNLARVLKTKDLPRIYTTFTPGTTHPAAVGWDLTDFTHQHAEVRRLLEDPAPRRADNIYASVQADFTGLATRMCVLNHVARALAGRRATNLLLGSLVAFALSAILVFSGDGLRINEFSWPGLVRWAGILASLFLVGIVTVWFDRISQARLRKRLAACVDQIFEEENRVALATGLRDDLRQNWQRVRVDTAETVAHAPLDLPWFGRLALRRVETALKVLSERYRRVR